MENSLLKNKNFILTFLGALVSNIGSLLYSFAVSFYILKISDNNSIIQGTYLAVCGVTYCIFSLFGGVLSDKFNKAKIMYICDYVKGIVLAISTILLMFVFDSNTGKIIILFVIGFFSNLIAAIFTPASGALIPEIVDENNLQKANSYFSLLNSFQSIIGILLAGILYAVMDINTLFIIVSVCYILSAISEMFIKYQNKNNDSKLTIKETFVDIKDGFKYLFSNKKLEVLVITCLFLNLFFPPIFDNFLPYHIANDIASSEYMLKDIISTPEMFSSIFNIIFGIGSLASGIMLSKIVIKNVHKSGSISLIVMSISIIIYAFILNYSIKNNLINASIISMCVLMLIVGFMVTLLNVPTNTCIQKIADENMLGKVNGTMAVGSMGLVPIATFIAGFVIKYFGEFSLVLVCGIGFTITSLIYVFNKSIKEL